MGALAFWGSGCISGCGFLVHLEDSYLRCLGVLDFSRTPGTQLHPGHRPYVLRAQQQVHQAQQMPTVVQAGRQVLVLPQLCPRWRALNMWGHHVGPPGPGWTLRLPDS